LQSGEEMSDIEQRILAAKQKAMDALTAADVVVFAFPLWNLTIPAKLQTFIDYVYQAGFTFKYDENGQLVSLMTDKKAIILSARGGIYSTPEAAPMEMAATYLKNVVGGVFGMQIVDEVIIEGHNAMPAQAETIISEGLEKVARAAKNFSAVTA
ncbi:MAG: FMN-dependent NADH-azoreductase, partial [Bacillus sp. (in: firmicutes)]